jgi:hypothetical protein
MSGSALTISKTLRTPGLRLLMPICPPFDRWRFAVAKHHAQARRADECQVRHVERDHRRVECPHRLLQLRRGVAVERSGERDARRAGLGFVDVVCQRHLGAPRAVPYSQA